MASTDSAVSLLANSRSISPASWMAWVDNSFCGTTLGFATATLTAATLGLPFAAGRRADFVAALGDDIKFVSLFQHLVFPQLHLPVGNALAGLHIVFHAMPWA